MAELRPPRLRRRRRREAESMGVCKCGVIGANPVVPGLRRIRKSTVFRNWGEMMKAELILLFGSGVVLGIIVGAMLTAMAG